MSDNPPNPKDKFGKEKASLQYVPLLPLLEVAVVMRGGAEKYDPHNWRDRPVEAMTYVSAAFRHLIFWVCGVEDDPESEVSHLAHAQACPMIIRDAQIHGTLIDNRPPPTDPAVLLEFLNKLISAPHFERKTNVEGPREKESSGEEGRAEEIRNEITIDLKADASQLRRTIERLQIALLESEARERGGGGGENPVLVFDEKAFLSQFEG